MPVQWLRDYSLQNLQQVEQNRLHLEQLFIPQTVATDALCAHLQMVKITTPPTQITYCSIAGNNLQYL